MEKYWFCASLGCMISFVVASVMIFLDLKHADAWIPMLIASSGYGQYYHLRAVLVTRGIKL